MTHGHQPKHAGADRPAPPTGGSGVIPPSKSQAARTLAIYEDHITRLQEESGNWRLRAELLAAEKAVLATRVDMLTSAMRNGRYAAMGGNAEKSTADLLRWGAKHFQAIAQERACPDPAIFSERAAMLEAADQMMQAALYPEDK